MDHDNEDVGNHQRGTLHRSFVVLRALAAHPEGRCARHPSRQGDRLTQATTHRLLQGLVQEGVVEQDQQHKLYRLGLDLFSLAALAGGVRDLRSLARPCCCACPPA